MDRSVRRCVACRQSVTKDTLLRVRWTEEELRVDAMRPHRGRGAYLHRTCLRRKEVQVPKVWEHAFRLPAGSITGTAVRELVRALEALEVGSRGD